MSTKYLNLACILTKKEIAIRYRGSALGFGWMVLLPVFMATLYTIVFWGIFEARWPLPIESSMPVSASRLESAGGFGAQLFCGLVIFNFFSDLLIRGSRVISDNAAMVRRVQFPRIALVVAMLFSSLINLFIGLSIALLFSVLSMGAFSVNLFGFLVSMTQLVILGFGVALWVSAIAVYVRDLQQIIPAAVVALLFLSPVFYSTRGISSGVKDLIVLNPFSFPIEAIRAAFFYGQLPHYGPTAVAFGIAISVLGSGWLVFKKLQTDFSEFI